MTSKYIALLTILALGSALTARAQINDCVGSWTTSPKLGTIPSPDIDPICLGSDLDFTPDWGDSGDQDGICEDDCNQTETGTLDVDYSWSITKQGESEPTSTGQTRTVFWMPLFAGTYTLELNKDATVETTNCGPTPLSESTQTTFHVISVTLSSLSRVPIYGGSSPIQKPVSVNITPSPSPVTVNLLLTTASGTGSALFANWQAGMQITSSQTVYVRGYVNSSAVDNIELTADLGGPYCDTEAFTVRTWPVNFKTTWTNASPGQLVFDYQWESESGDLGDVDYIKIYETVDYYPSPWPNPPFSNHPTPEPVTNEMAFGTEGFFRDLHKGPTYGFTTPYTSAHAYGDQTYKFHDIVLDTWQTLMGPHTIDREVYDDNGEWKYRVKKHSVTSPGKSLP